MTIGISSPLLPINTMRTSSEYCLKFSKIFLFLQIIITPIVVCGKCPPKEVVDPCVCTSQTITCEGSEPIDLKTIFRNISKSLSNNEKSFQYFVLNNPDINRLENNTFSDITFRFMTVIDAQSLETIDENSFGGTSKIIEVFEMFGENSLKNMSQLFRVLDSFEKVVSLTLSIEGLDSLPSYAFSGLNRLQELTLANEQLNHLSDNCLHFNRESNQSLVIDFSNNNLTEFSFENYSLSGVSRPLELDLKDNYLSVLEARVFRPFLLAHMWNSINVQANPLNCSDCRNRWLVEDKHIFGDNVFEARCSHFVSIFELDLDYYRHCI